MNDDDQTRRMQEPPRSTDRLVLSTTDPVIAIEAEHRAEWKRHPFATIRLETSQDIAPEWLAADSPWMIEPAHAPDPGAGPPRPAAPPERVHEPGSTNRAPENRPDTLAADPSTVRPSNAGARPTSPRRTRAAAAGYPWVVAGAAMLGGLIGSVGYLHLSGSWRRRPPTTT